MFQHWILKNWLSMVDYCKVYHTGSIPMPMNKLYLALSTHAEMPTENWYPIRPLKWSNVMTPNDGIFHTILNDKKNPDPNARIMMPSTKHLHVSHYCLGFLSTRTEFSQAAILPCTQSTAVCFAQHTTARTDYSIVTGCVLVLQTLGSVELCCKLFW